VTADHPEKPITLGKYDSNGCWVKPDVVPLGHSTFAAYGQWDSRIVPGPGHAPEAGLCWLPFEINASLERGSGTWARYGVAFHHSCGQLLQQRLGYNLNFNHVWPLLRQRSSCKHDPSTAPCWQHAGEDVSSNHLNCSYGGIDRYHRVSRDDVQFEEADFAFRFVSAADEYMLLDPLQCSNNADRIVRVWEPLVKQFQQAAGKGKGKHTSSKGKGNGGGPSRDAHAHGGKPGTKGGSTAAAVAGLCKGSQLQDGKKARKQGALARAQVRARFSIKSAVQLVPHTCHETTVDHV
jgi:hypothetical protein